MKTPADIPQVYKNTVEDLLLEILNVMPVLNGDPNTVLNGVGNWIPAGSGGGGSTLLPEPGADGNILYGHSDNWINFPRNNVFTWDEINNRAYLNFASGDTINLGSTALYDLGDGELNIMNSDLLLGQNLKLQNGNLSVRSKVNDGSYIDIIKRNDNYTQTRADFLYMRNLNDPTDPEAKWYYDFASNYHTFTGHTYFYSKNGNNFYFRSGSNFPLIIHNNGFYSTTANDIGLNLNPFGNLYLNQHVMLKSATSAISFNGNSWIGGAVGSGAVTMNSNAYINLTVNGTAYKLLIAN